MMQLRLANSPVSWGVEQADDPRNPPWERVLDEIAAAGYEGTELGVVGYLPEEPGRLEPELAQRGVELVAGYVHCPATDAEELEKARALTHRVSRTLQALHAKHLVIIDERPPERLATAGNSRSARRLDDRQFGTLIDSLRTLARIATGDYGLTPVLHHHAAGYIEFRDEIDRAVDALAPAGVRLCLDTGHAAYAGIDAADLYSAYRDVVGYLHLKDVDPTVRDRAISEGLDFWSAVRAGIFCPVGQGMVDFPRLQDALSRGGYEGWATVEQDREPSEAASAAERARLSLQYLRATGIARSVSG
jgi:inosose dehydratase